MTAVFSALAFVEGFSQGFVNLNFESANVSGYSSPGSIPTNNAIPGWTLYFEGRPWPTVAYNDIALDGESVDLEGTNNQSGPSAIQGKYSIFVQGGSSADPNHNGASIMQTAQIPVSAESITYWGGSLQVTFNGQALAFNAIGTGSGYTIWQADISAYAGQTGTLSFDAPWQTSALLDNIQFSTSPVPEPSALALSTLGAVLFGWRRFVSSQR